MNRIALTVVLSVILFTLGVRAETTVAFLGGDIITLDPSSPNVQAMLVTNGRIVAMGSDAQVRANIPPGAPIVNLHQQTVLPGFIDAHSHFPASGIRSVSLDLSPPPIGDTDKIEVLLQRVADAVIERTSGEWLLGYNYDNTALQNGRHPTRQQLDQVAPDNPVYLWHNSGHMGVANSKALSLLSIDEQTPIPSGGNIGRDLNTNVLNGLLQETAAPPLGRIVRELPWRKQLHILNVARDDYLAAGVTTVQNGYASKGIARVLKIAQLLGVINQRVVIWPAHKKFALPKRAGGKPKKTFFYSLGAVKLIVDGSPQGLTAFLSEPYFIPPNQSASYRGFPVLTQQVLNGLVLDYHQRGFQLALHGNGDAAIDMIIEAVTIAQNKSPRSDTRHILVHAQTLRKDQTEQLKKLGITPSFFSSHTYYWGDWHRTNSLGPVRAANISPTRWAQDIGLRFSIHSDTPVTPIDPLQLLWSATERKTRSGYLLGPEQRLSLMQSLRAITIDAAWQNNIDEHVGSLSIGKYADFVVLSNSPFETQDIRQLHVLETWIGGVRHFVRLAGAVKG